MAQVTVTELAKTVGASIEKLISKSDSEIISTGNESH